MTRTFDARPRTAPDPERATDAAPPDRAVPPAGTFALLAARLHGGVPAQRAAVAEPARDFSGIVGPGRSPSVGTLPAGLRADVEARSGLPMDDVRVHRDSGAPARIGALAYARGRDIHLGPGQERHLPHEAWHVVQQKQGRVRPTQRLGDVPVNDDRALEREADTAGAAPRPDGPASPRARAAGGVCTVVQGIFWKHTEGGWEKLTKGEEGAAPTVTTAGHAYGDVFDDVENAWMTAQEYKDYRARRLLGLPQGGRGRGAPRFGGRGGAAASSLSARAAAAAQPYNSASSSRRSDPSRASPERSTSPARVQASPPRQGDLRPLEPFEAQDSGRPVASDSVAILESFLTHGILLDAPNSIKSGDSRSTGVVHTNLIRTRERPDDRLEEAEVRRRAKLMARSAAHLAGRGAIPVVIEQRGDVYEPSIDAEKKALLEKRALNSAVAIIDSERLPERLRPSSQLGLINPETDVFQPNEIETSEGIPASSFVHVLVPIEFKAEIERSGIDKSKIIYLGSSVSRTNYYVVGSRQATEVEMNVPDFERAIEQFMLKNPERRFQTHAIRLSRNFGEASSK